MSTLKKINKKKDEAKNVLNDNNIYYKFNKKKKKVCVIAFALSQFVAEYFLNDSKLN